MVAVWFAAGDRAESTGRSCHARFRLESPLVSLPGDRFVVRSTRRRHQRAGTVLDIAPPRFKRKGRARHHLNVARHRRRPFRCWRTLKQAVRRACCPDLRAADALRADTSARYWSTPAGGPPSGGDREWYLNRTEQSPPAPDQPASSDFPAGAPAAGGLPRGAAHAGLPRPGAVFAQLLCGSSRRKAWSGASATRSGVPPTRPPEPGAGAVVQGLEPDFRSGGSGAPSPDEALALVRHGVPQHHRESTSSSRSAWSRPVVRRRQRITLFFHADALTPSGARRPACHHSTLRHKT